MSQIEAMENIQRRYDISGGEGRVAGPGGYASPQSYETLDAWRASAAATPSPVGGVYLGGAGKALEALGNLSGFALDNDTGKLVLIGCDDRKIALPPLRLDDVVTVFRTAYDWGESPSVTIDPDPRNPTGPLMHVKHGPGTQGTYVGWVLYECDRIMKNFQLGQDNITGDTVDTRVPGYQDVSEKVYFADTIQPGARGSTWERFWIVPAALHRFDSAPASLSLFELPLKVNTQKMRWHNGKLVDDESGHSSAGAQVFAEWFTARYPEIANEVYATPPAGSGMSARVPVFHELRRIALIAAIAERLRDSGQRMPPWMRDYAVAPFPLLETTPSLTRVRHRQDGGELRTASIYGGVNLAPADKDVHAYSDTKARQDSAFVKVSRDLASAVAPRIADFAKLDRPDAAIQWAGVRVAGSAAALPGAGTLAPLPNRQRVTDIEAPAGPGRTITLTRFYNSLFDPAGEFGRGWTLDLPRLLISKAPLSRDGKQSRYRVVYHLTSPLASIDARFARTERVEPYGAVMAVPDHRPDIAGVATGTARILGVNTTQVLFRNGAVWHFDDAGHLVLDEYGGGGTRYLRDSAGRVRQIVGYAGRIPTAEIRLSYDTQDRIVQANSELRFEYDAAGRLAVVTRAGAKETVAYAYEGGLLSSISGRGMESSFGYNGRGQLMWETEGGHKREYSQNGLTIRTANGATWSYDARMRPVETDDGGRRSVVKYGKDGGFVETVSDSGESLYTRTVSPLGDAESVAWSSGINLEFRRDAGGRPISLTRNGTPVWKAHWRPDGLLEMLRIGGAEVRPRLHEDGWWNAVVVSAPAKEGNVDQWLEEAWDIRGRLRRTRDSSGFEYVMNYDDEGRLQSYGRLTKEGKLAGASLNYGRDGMLTSIHSSWGSEKREYTRTSLKGITVERQGARSVTTFDSLERLAARSHFDGGIMKWVYSSSGDGLAEVQLPNGESIRFDGTAGEISLGPARVTTAIDAQGRLTAMTWYVKLIRPGEPVEGKE
jgi:YD repeat-containing protein